MSRPLPELVPVTGELRAALAPTAQSTGHPAARRFSNPLVSAGH
ncbi:hypothetical protein [Nonomuraea sp. PA05]|nr:hypothetical protein [Nonomuraea sp. PA05]